MRKTGNNYREEKKKEVDKNYDFFKTLEPDPQNHGKYALIRHCEIQGYYDTLEDAKQASWLIEDGIYSIQKVGEKPQNLGYYSYAMFQE